MPIFAPEYARYSPIALHHLLLVERLHAEGYSVLDLTPGPDPFKERFAGEYESVSVLSIYFKQREWIKAKVRRRSQLFTKGLLSTLGIEPSSVARTLRRIHAFLTLKSGAPRLSGSYPVNEQGNKITPVDREHAAFDV